MKDGFYIFYRIRQTIDTHWMEHESPEKMRVPYGTLSEAKAAYAKMLEKATFDDCDYDIFQYNDGEWLRMRKGFSEEAGKRLGYRVIPR